MMKHFLILFLTFFIVTNVFCQFLESSVPDPPNPHFYYKFEGDISKYIDQMCLKTGELKIGKYQEWGTLVYFWYNGNQIT